MAKPGDQIPHRSQPHRPRPHLPDGPWFTIEEAAHEIGRAVQTVRNLLTKHQLPRRIVTRGRRRLRIVWLSSETVAKLRRLTQGF